jgi:hypothetical protein
MKKAIILIILFSFLTSISQNCNYNNNYCCNTNNCNSNVNGCCCGRDPEFYSNSYSDKEVHKISDDYGFCRLDDYDFINIPSFASIPGDWMVVWEDDFNYGLLDESFYRNSLPWSNYDEGFKNSVDDPSAIKFNNGKLILQGYFDPDPNKKYLYYGKNIDNPSTECYPCGYRHFDYVTGSISTKFMFPINARYQSSIKAHDNADAIWSSFWLFGYHDPNLPACPTVTMPNSSSVIKTIRYTELDIFEIRKADGSHYSNNYPNHTFFMTYHNTKYGYCGTRRREALVRYTGTQLTGGFHQYDLIWDKWKIQWWFNGNIIHSVNRYYNMKNFWGNNLRKKYFRHLPINSYNDMVNINGDKKVSFNTYFPYNNVPMRIIFGFAPNKIDNTNIYLINPNSVGPNYSYQMDWLKVWIRANCNYTNTVYSLNYVYKDNNEAYIIETGRVIKTNSGTILTLDWPSTYSSGWGVTSAIFAATEEIEFNDGFGVENGNLFAFPTYCETSWDNRLMNNNNNIPMNYDFNKDDIEFSYEENELENDTDEADLMNEKSEIQIYPNPSDGTLYLNDLSGKINSIEIYDVYDRLIYRTELNSNLKVELKNEKNGVYIIKFYRNNKLLDLKKVIISK